MKLFLEEFCFSESRSLSQDNLILRTSSPEDIFDSVTQFCFFEDFLPSPLSESRSGRIALHSESVNQEEIVALSDWLNIKPDPLSLEHQFRATVKLGLPGLPPI